MSTIHNYSSSGCGSSSSSSSASSMTPVTPEEVSLGYDVAGLEKVTKSFSKCYSGPDTYTQIPALLFKFKDDSTETAFLITTNFHERGRRGGMFSSGGTIPSKCIQFTGINGQGKSHAELLSLIRTALQENDHSKSTALSKSVTVLSGSSSSS